MKIGSAAVYMFYHTWMLLLAKWREIIFSWIVKFFENFLVIIFLNPFE